MNYSIIRAGVGLLLASLVAVVGAGCGQPASDGPISPKSHPTSTVLTGRPAPSPGAGSVTLIRDEWGVPHIYAERLEDAAFGLGYAQAEDRLDDIYKNVRMATGTMAEAFGEEHAEMDYMVRLVRNAEVCRAYWDRAPAPIRALGDGFIRGVMAYVAEHPEQVPEFACDLEGWQCGAVGRLMILQWPVQTLMKELRRFDKAPPMGSNGWAVAPWRSAEGCAVLLLDPHLDWEGIQVFYEARMHCADYECCGFFVVGSPLPALGHTAFVSWACTTGGPDTSDVYMMKHDPKMPMVYEYDGQLKAAEVKPVVVPVKGAKPFQQPALYTVNGPAIAEPDAEKGVLYVGKTPYLDEAGLFEQIYAMVTAKSSDEFYAALAMNQLMEQNVLFADTSGNIQYVRTGRVPIRPEGYNWEVPVPGNTSATAWQGIHSIEDLVQLKNPPQGYLQNCNCSPAVMMLDSPLTPDRYPAYIYHCDPGLQTPRGRRALAVLSSDDSLTKDEARVLAMDAYDMLAVPWQKALREAVDAEGEDYMADGDFAAIVEALLGWDGRFVKESHAAPFVMFWRLKCEAGIDIVAVAEERPLSNEDQARMLALLAETVEDVTKRYGTLDICWGDVHWVGRGGRYFPCDGADFGGGAGDRNLTETLLCVQGKELPDQPGRYVGWIGSESVMLCFMRPEGVESYSCVMWGQSGRPESPHYLDQAERLFGQSQLKPTRFAWTELRNHIESERTLATQ
ncbi:MAG TPA: penicillin acylase family protein [Candidatus Hydrogenedentes bacterium]|nr:penicillin acylase family protein [Candidatus Hydrogenedentota bacterium]HPG67071.1 penicillin acylase family protein [Candidatus Hydrogenedentota bacterium]